MSIHLKRDLDAIHRDLLSMCALVEEMIHKAIDGLAEANDESASELAEKDNAIDEFDVQIEEDCLKILALHQPVAIDLRRITTVMKISGELERVGDLGVHIAERVTSLDSGVEISVLDRLREMAKIALEMLHATIDAYVALDCDKAREVCGRDDVVDELNREIIDDLVHSMKANPRSIETAMHLFSASRHLERVADHATNIAEDVVYLVEGVIIRHRYV